MHLDFIIGYDLSEFEEYYKKIWDTIPNRKQSNLDDFERNIIIEIPSNLIIWKEGKRIMVMPFGIKYIQIDIMKKILEKRMIEKY